MAPPYFSLDFIALVLRRSIFNPFVAWMIPLCLRAVATPYHDPAFKTSCAYAAFLTLLFVLSAIDHRIAYGRPRSLNWEDEVVVITGGASGLGRTLAEMYGMRGASVAILDVSMPEEGENSEGEAWQSVKWYRCDVSSAENVERAKTEVERDLGVCTILINNAGIVNGKPLLSLTAREVQRNFDVNLISHFNTIRAFLPGMLSRADSDPDDEDEDGVQTSQKSVSLGGTIVTVASVLGKIPASHLSDYCAAKAGLIAMHASLRAELSSSSFIAAHPNAPDVSTILVTPGQLWTPLFASVQTPSSFIGPVVEPVDLAREIVKMVDFGESGEISLPLYARWIEWTGVLPAGLQKVVRWASGMDRAMEGAHRKDEKDEAGIKKRN